MTKITELNTNFSHSAILDHIQRGQLKTALSCFIVKMLTTSVSKCVKFGAFAVLYHECSQGL